MGEDDARNAILARRARFVATALATAGLVVGSAEGCSSGDDTSGKGDAALGGGGTGGPEPCLSPRIGGGGGTTSSGGSGGTTEAGADVTSDADLDGAAGAAGMPQPCLTPGP